MSPTSFMVNKTYATSFLNGKNVVEPFSDFKQIMDV